MPFTRAQVARIRDGSAHAYASGEIAWRQENGGLRGDVDVAVDDMPEGSVRLVVSLGGRPNKPSFVLLVNNDHPHRLDVNQPHKQFHDTHVQWRDDCSDTESTRDAVGEFPPIPKTGTVDGAAYLATLRAFATYLNIETSTMEWNDPPPGVLQ